MAVKSLGETTVLPKDTVILKRNYKSADGVMYAVNFVIQGLNRSSIHRPELCLPSQGFTMEAARRTPLNLAGRTEPLVARRIDAYREAGKERMPVYLEGQTGWLDQPDGGVTSDLSLVYWFESRERRNCSHTQRILTDVWDRSIHNRINRWVMLAVNVSPRLETPDAVERFETFLSELVPQVVLKK
jgi:hypothetical protein